MEQSDNGTLWVLDKNQRKQWKSCPKKAARETDFYTGNFGVAVDPFHVENALCTCEGQWATVIRQIVSTSRLPDAADNAFADLMTFVAFQAMRVPAARRQIAGLMHDFSRAELQAKLANSALWASFIQHEKAQGRTILFSRQELLEFATGDNYSIDVDKTWPVQEQMRIAIQLILVLAQREWSVFKPCHNAPDFVCSDAPVCVTARDHEASDDSWPGFCLPRSFITVPLDRRHALVGFFEGKLDLELPADQVAGLNTMTITNANYIYSAERHFSWMTETGMIAGPDDLLTVPVA